MLILTCPHCRNPVIVQDSSSRGPYDCGTCAASFDIPRENGADSWVLKTLYRKPVRADSRSRPAVEPRPKQEPAQSNTEHKPAAVPADKRPTSSAPKISAEPARTADPKRKWSTLLPQAIKPPAVPPLPAETDTTPPETVSPLAEQTISDLCTTPGTDPPPIDSSYPDQSGENIERVDSEDSVRQSDSQRPIPQEADKPVTREVPLFDHGTPVNADRDRGDYIVTESVTCDHSVDIETLNHLADRDIWNRHNITDLPDLPSMPSDLDSSTSRGRARAGLTGAASFRRSGGGAWKKFTVGALAGVVLFQVVAWRWHRSPSDPKRDQKNPTIASGANESPGKPNPVARTQTATPTTVPRLLSASSPASSSPTSPPTSPSHAMKAANNVSLKSSALPVRFDSRDVQIAIDQTKEDYEQWQSADSEDLREQYVRRLYVRLCQLSERLTMGDRSEPLFDLQLAEGAKLLDAMCGDNERFGLLNRMGKKWWSWSDRPTNGIALAGSVAEVSKVNSSTARLTLELANAPRQTVSVIHRHDFSQPLDYQVGDSLAVMGMVVENPQERFPGLVDHDVAVVVAEVYFQPDSRP